MNPRFAIFAAVLISFFQPSPTWSKPLARADIPADSSYILHIDMDAFRASSLGKALIAQLTDENADKLNAFVAMSKFDPRTQLHGVSIFGTGGDSKNGVLLAYGDFDTPHLQTLIKAAKEYESSNHGSHVIHSWTDKNKGETKRIFGVLSSQRLFLARNRENLKGALDIIDKSSASLVASQTFSSLGKHVDGKFIELAAHKLPTADENPIVAALTRVARETRGFVTAKRGKVNAEIELKAESPEAAGQLTSVLEGFLALVKLQAGRPEQKWTENLAVKQNDNLVNAAITIPTDDLIAMMKAKAAAKRRSE